MTNRFFIVTLLAALILACGCTGTTTDPTAPTPTATAGASAATPTPDVRDYTFTQTITYSDENGTTVITKNKLGKTATLDITMHLAPPEIEGVDKTRFYEFGTALTAGVLQMAFFNETALAEFNAQVAEWNTQEYVVQDDSPPEQAETVPGENPLDGYTVQRVTVRLLEQGTETGIADIVITGPDKADIAITYP